MLWSVDAYSDVDVCIAKQPTKVVIEQQAVGLNKMPHFKVKAG
jgi:hypothetical protein